MTRAVIEGMNFGTSLYDAGRAVTGTGLTGYQSGYYVAGAEILTSFMDWHEIPHVIVSERDGMEGMQQHLVK